MPTAVCAKTFALLSRAPYAGLFELLAPAEPVDPETAPLFACSPPQAIAGAAVAAAPARRAVAGLGSVGTDAGACC